ncbi:MAG TPA: sugar phosphate nucleotidyltransferase, partial [Micavibrio sp.]
MNSAFPDHAFILAAGMGKRLQPYTDTIPKPLVPVNGKPMIDYTLDALEKIGIEKITVNLHYRA